MHPAPLPRPASAPSGASLAAAAPRSAPILLGAGLLVLGVCLALTTLELIALEPKLLWVLAVGGPLALALLTWPSWIVPAFIGLTYTSIGSSFFGGLPSPIESGAVVLLGLAAWRARTARHVARDAAVVTTLLALALAGTALVGSGGLGGLVDLLKPLLFLPLAALCLRGREDVERTVVVLVVLGVVLGAGAMWSVLVGPTALFPLAVDETGGEASRAAGPFGEPNFFALSLAIVVPLAMHLVAQGGLRRALGYASVLAVTGGVLAAGSRAALLTVVVAVLAGLLAGQARRAKGAVLVVLAALAVLVPVFAGQAGSSAERTVSGRATENLIAVAMFADHPLTGVGPGGYPVLYRDYARDIGNDPRALRHAHSLPLEIAAEQGLVGLGAWLVAGLLLWRLVVVRRVWQLPVGRALVLCLGAYGFNSLFLHGSQMRVLMMLVGALIALAWARDRLAPSPAPRLVAA